MQCKFERRGHVTLRVERRVCYRCKLCFRFQNYVYRSGALLSFPNSKCVIFCSYVAMNSAFCVFLCRGLKICSCWKGKQCKQCFPLNTFAKAFSHTRQQRQMLGLFSFAQPVSKDFLLKVLHVFYERE